MKFKMKYFTPLLVVFLLLGVSFVYANNNNAEDAPLNPKFTKYIRDAATKRMSFMSDEGYWLGEVPPPMDMSHIKTADLRKGLEIDSYPTTYDLRSLGKTPSVRNQGGCGSCWTFATYSSMESCGLPSNTWNFSEQDLNATHGFDLAECAGGNHQMSTAYLSRWAGPISETDVPYPYGTGRAARDIDGYTVQKHIQQIFWLPDRSGPLDNDTIKYFVTNYGAVHVSYYSSSTYMDLTDLNYYNYSNTNTNHAVAVVGWDDNYDKNNFKTTPPGNGAFIIRNSWGTGRHDNGYFYISYYDTSFIPRACYSNAEATTNYDTIYQYDELGVVSTSGYGSTTAWGANIFTAQETSQLKAVSFYLNDINASYEIYIYTGVTAGSPTSGSLSASKTGSKTYPGFYTVELDSSVSLSNGELFSVVIKFVNNTYTYPLSKESVYGGYSSAATANTGESFISSNGTSWSDISTGGANICIKAYASASSSPFDSPDFNQDNSPDIVWRNSSSGQNALWYMNGLTRTGITYLPTLGDTNWELAASADFTNDGKPDLLWRNYTTGQNGVWHMDNTTRTTITIINPSSNTDWKIVGAADFNGDDKADILWRNTTTGENALWYMNGLTRTGITYIPSLSNTDWECKGAADFNGDGHPDIVWRHNSTGQNGVWYMNNASRTGQAYLPTLGKTQWDIAGLSDFTGDNNVDILWRDSVTGQNGVWHMNNTSRLNITIINPSSNTDWKICN